MPEESIWHMRGCGGGCVREREKVVVVVIVVVVIVIVAAVE